MKRLNIEENYTNYHFIGIGGINMSGLAEILHNDGCVVTGSDRSGSKIIDSLRKKGIDARIGHDAKNVSENVQVVVYNAAVPADNAEILVAKQRCLRLMDRAELLGLLMKNYETSICVAGTHGKTTTTSMLAEIFMMAHKNPTVMSGGILPSMGGAMRIGSQDFIISEACEYNNSFLKFYPHIGIILNLEMDHSDFFADIGAMRKSFSAFAQKIPRNGLLVVNSEIDELGQLIRGLDCDVVAFGKNGSVVTQNIHLSKEGYPLFQVVGNGKTLGEIALKIPGDHNIQNAMAAICVAMHCGIDFAIIAAAFSQFAGAIRRFQRIGNYNGATIIDDYAHHPTEVAATIAAAKNMPHNRLWVVFQPHTRERTAEFLNEFAHELAQVDELIILDIFNPAGREEEHCKVHSKDLVEQAEKVNVANVHYMSSFSTCVEHLKQQLAQNDLLITMGAGNVYEVAEALYNSH
ncbi:MAG: UDP-N-acetylmuramate--L-alanine ligase [Defluviitaleaceae bacterium]|nr:UDP-N-acetylmuramate--L-alanine ligase [Defluviitaleaceae bacterium]